jgi:hypothetical protein
MQKAGNKGNLEKQGQEEAIKAFYLITMTNN